MTWRYVPDKTLKDTAEGLLKKLRPLSDKECMDVIREIQQNYRLPGRARTVGEMLAEARQRSGAQKLAGHDIMALERFDSDTRHMIVFDVPSHESPMDMSLNYSEDDNPLAPKSDFKLAAGGRNGLEPVKKTVIDKAVCIVYHPYLANPKPENVPILGDLYNGIRRQPEPEAQRIAAALELYVHGSLNVFNHRTN